MNNHPRLAAEQCVLIVVDIQEAFVPHIPEINRVIERSGVMIEAAKLLRVPMVVTEQYPKGLGRTVEPIRAALGERPYYDKVAFSVCGDEAAKKALLDTGRKQVLLVGIETHVCITQTTLDALALGLQPFLAVDAIASRRATDAQVALERLRQAGAVLTSTEAAIFEMMGSSRHPAFKEISKLVK